MRLAHPRKKHAEVIHHLSDRPHSRTGILADCFLLNGNRRAKAADEVYARLLHLPQELAGVRGKALHVAPLPLSIDGIEGKRRFAAATHAGQHDQAVARNANINVFKIMLLCAANNDFVGFHAGPF